MYHSLENIEFTYNLRNNASDFCLTSVKEIALKTRALAGRSEFRKETEIERPYIPSKLICPQPESQQH